MNGIDRRSLMRLAAGGIALAALPARGAAPAAGFEPPSTPMLYARRLERGLPGDALLKEVSDLIASGAVAGYWEGWLNAWDAAPGALLVREAGGIFSSLDGEKVQLFFLLISPPDRPGDHLRALVDDLSAEPPHPFRDLDGRRRRHALLHHAARRGRIAARRAPGRGRTGARGAQRAVRVVR